jgi:hypothetical protein
VPQVFSGRCTQVRPAPEKEIGMTEAATWHDCGEGPWATRQEAQDFADAEIAWMYRIRKKDDGWHIIILSPYGDKA